MSEHIDSIKNAVLENKTVIFTYNGKAEREIDPLSLKVSGVGNVILTGLELATQQIRSFKLSSIEASRAGSIRTAGKILSEADKSFIRDFDIDAVSANPLLAPEANRTFVTYEQAHAQKLSKLEENAAANENLIVIESIITENNDRASGLDLNESTLMRVLDFSYLGKKHAIQEVRNFFPESIDYSRKTNNVVISGFLFNHEELGSAYRSYNVENLSNLNVKEAPKNKIVGPYDIPLDKRPRPKSQKPHKSGFWGLVGFVVVSLLGIIGFIADIVSSVQRW